MPNEAWADNKDSCCHQIGMSLNDERTVLDMPLHGWIESVFFLHLVRSTPVHRSMTVVKMVHLLATGFGQVTPSSPGCWTQQSRISAPNSSKRTTVPMFALASEARGASLSPQVHHASSMPSLLWPPRSAPQSCRFKSNRTQHLASVASGLSQSVPLVSFMPVSVDPSVSSTIFGLLYKHICPCCAWTEAKHVLHVTVVKHGACESDTEPRLHLRLAEPSVTAMSIILWLLFVKSSPGSASRSLIVGHPSGHKLCLFIQRTDCLLVGDCFGRKQRIPASCLEEAPWDALTTSIFKHLMKGNLRTTSSHTFNTH